MQERYFLLLLFLFNWLIGISCVLSIEIVSHLLIRAHEVTLSGDIYKRGGCIKQNNHKKLVAI